MAINLTKAEAEVRLVSLKKAATEVIEQKGLGNQKARVALALDISGSMGHLFAKGTVQNACDKLLGLAMNFDDNAAADIFLFGVKDHAVGELSQANFYNFVKDNVQKHPLEGGTKYAGVMQRIINFYTGTGSTVAAPKKGLFGGMFGSKQAAPTPSVSTSSTEPVYVLFLTDGDNSDHGPTESIIKEAAKHGIFWQFVGIGSDKFKFLEKLDDMPGRAIDNADFFQLNDIDKVSDKELYSRMLQEFPTWINQAKTQGII